MTQYKLAKAIKSPASEQCRTCTKKVELAEKMFHGERTWPADEPCDRECPRYAPKLLGDIELNLQAFELLTPLRAGKDEKELASVGRDCREFFDSLRQPPGGRFEKWRLDALLAVLSATDHLRIFVDDTAEVVDTMVVSKAGTSDLRLGHLANMPVEGALSALRDAGFGLVRAGSTPMGDEQKRRESVTETREWARGLLSRAMALRDAGKDSAMASGGQGKKPRPKMSAVEQALAEGVKDNKQTLRRAEEILREQGFEGSAALVSIDTVKSAKRRQRKSG